jgi:magnesium-transporting ATPase (P-type)
MSSLPPLQPQVPQPPVTAALPRVVPAGAGATWWTKGCRIFASQPGTWIGIVVVYIIVAVLITAVPYVGRPGYALLAPVFMGGLMLGCRAIDRGERLHLAHLFEGFQGSHFVGLLTVGVVTMVVSLAVTALTKSSYLDDLTMNDMANLSNMEIPSGALGTDLLKWLVALLLGALSSMLTWFAPATVVLGGTTAVAAMKLSFRAFSRNWLPFLVYASIAVGALLVVGVALLIVTVAMAPGGSDLFSLLATAAVFTGFVTIAGAVIALFAGPIVVGSIYAGYRDMLAIDSDVPAPSR